MIPVLRAQLPRGLSYPLQVKDLAAGLAGWPLFTVRFSARPVWQVTVFNEILAEKRRYNIVRAAYDPSSPAPWSLDVYPVEHGLRSPVRALLMAECLPAVAQWASSWSDDTWSWRHHRITARFDPLEISLAINLADGA